VLSKQASRGYLDRNKGRLKFYIDRGKKVIRYTNTHTHIHIYIYVCVCVCVCVSSFSSEVSKYESFVLDSQLKSQIKLFGIS
jgi:hypothetical protein